MNKSLSVIIPAYNEERNIRAAVESVTSVIVKHISDYELLVFNDGSVDGTQQAAEQLAKSDFHVKVFHNPQNRGLAHIAIDGIAAAQKEYLTWFPGDNSIEKDSLELIFGSVGKADIGVAYMANVASRPLVRRYLSILFTGFLNLVFGLHMKYYNGATVYPTKLLQSLKIKSRGYEFYAELLIRGLKSGHNYIEIPFNHKTDGEKNSKALTLKNFISVIRTTFVLVNDIYIRRQPCG